MDSLVFYKVETLPTDENTSNYYGAEKGYGNNLPTYSFEYATDSMYRFFQYNNLFRTDKFWQPKNESVF